MSSSGGSATMPMPNMMMGDTSNRKWRGPMAMSVLATVLVLISIILGVLVTYSQYLTWYWLSGGGYSAAIGLFNQCNPSGGCYSASGTFSNMWYATSYLMVVALILGIVGIVAGARMMSGKMKAGAAGGVTVLLAFVLAIIGPIWMAVGQPSALGNVCGGVSPSYCTSYWGSTTISGTTITWGPGAGWYLAVIGAVLFLISFLWGMAVYRKSMKTA